VAMVAMLLRGKLTVLTVKNSFVDGARFAAMIMAIVIGAQFFGRFMSLSMIPRKLIHMLEPMMGHPMFIVVMILLLLLFLGMILESAAIMVMIIPITDPLIRAMKVDPIWFGVLCSLYLMLGMLTPPVGLATYAASTAAKCPMGGVFRYTALFAFAAAAIETPLLFIWPGLITWLPNLLGL
jgi:C4-dicarboxylate transporter DctM subunit